MKKFNIYFFLNYMLFSYVLSYLTFEKYELIGKFDKSILNKPMFDNYDFIMYSSKILETSSSIYNSKPNNIKKIMLHDSSNLYSALEDIFKFKKIQVSKVMLDFLSMKVIKRCNFEDFKKTLSNSDNSAYTTFLNGHKLRLNMMIDRISESINTLHGPIIPSEDIEKYRELLSNFNVKWNNIVSFYSEYFFSITTIHLLDNPKIIEDYTNFESYLDYRLNEYKKVLEYTLRQHYEIIKIKL